MNRRATGRSATDGRRTGSSTDGTTRRRLLAGTGVVALGGLAGCLDDITEYESAPYGVDSETAAGADYDLETVDTVVIEETLGLGPIEETVVARNHVVEYEKTVDIGPLGEFRGGVFVTFSTPQISVLGQEFNPVADMDTEELIELVQDNYDDLENIEHDTDEEVEVLEEPVTRSRFEADATFDGTSVEVDLHVTEAVATEDDLVVTIGVYPTTLRGQEEDHTVSMMGGVTPDADLDDAEENGGDGGDDGSDDGGGDEEDDGGLLG